MAIKVSGTLIQNTSRQSWNSQTMKIPYSGPSTLPSSCAAPIPPSTPARLRCDHKSAPSAERDRQQRTAGDTLDGAADDQHERPGLCGW